MTQAHLAVRKALHVAFFMHDLSGGGVERMRLTLIAALRKRGMLVTLIVTEKKGTLAESLPSDLPVVVLCASRTCFAIPKLVNFLRETRVDILVSSLDHNNIAAMVALRVSGVATRLVICQHNALSAEAALGWKYRLVPWAYRLLHHYAERIVAVSHGVSHELSEISSIPQEKISVICNPIVDEGFLERLSGPPPHTWLKKKDCQVLVFAGRLTAQKDVYTLLWAMKTVLQCRRSRLILLGEGDEKHSLQRFAREAGIADAVDFVGFQTNPLPWIRHADALVLSSRYEGLGNVIVEALACGTQVIATDCPYGPAELLLQGRLGTLVPVGNVGALAEAILNHRVVDPALMQARAKDFDVDVCADAHIDLFQTIMKERRRGTRARDGSVAAADGRGGRDDPQRHGEGWRAFGCHPESGSCVALAKPGLCGRLWVGTPGLP